MNIAAAASRLTRSGMAGGLSCAALFCVLPLAAQQDAVSGDPTPQAESRLQGVVGDELTFEPIPGAVLTVLGSGVEIESGSYGEFEFPISLPAGSFSVRASAPGYVSTVEQVELMEDRVVFLQFFLASLSATVDDLLVTGRANPVATESTRTAADLLALRVPSARRPGGEVGATGQSVRLRGQSTLSLSSDPIVLLDGIRVGSPGEAFEILSRIPASEVETLEILRGPSASLVHASYAANGVIVITTRSGQRNVD